MGVVESLFKSAVEENPALRVRTDGMAVDRLLDEIVVACAGLIADIEDKKVEPAFLTREIEKRVDSQKELYDPEGVKRTIFDTIYGYGILQTYITDDSISDIDATRYDYILAKRRGVFERLPVAFSSEEVFERYCRLLIVRHGGIINEVDTHCRVSDKKHFLRINVSIPPRNISGTALSIRKHPKSAYSLDSLVQIGFMSENERVLLESFNRQKRNILICGKGGSGKTTLLRSLIEDVDEYERMLICETDSEIYPQRLNAIVQKIHKRRESGNAVTLETLIREGLTMSLDTYCIGEIVGDEAWDFIKAGHTDHRTLATLHANSAEDAINRLMLLSENKTRLKPEAVKQIIESALDVIVYLKGFKIAEIIENP
jgi:pilus assembly protein CpaF